MPHEVRISLIVSGINTERTWNGRAFKASNCTLEDRGHKYENCVSLDYSYETELDSQEVRRDRYYAMLLEFAETTLDILSLLIVRPLEVVFSEFLHDDQKIKRTLPKRQVNLGMFELLEAFSGHDPRRLSRYHAVMKLKALKKLEAMTSEIQKTDNHLPRKVVTPLRWFRKGNNEFVMTDKLISHWIAFNSLYADPNSNEREAIQTFIQRHISHLAAQKYVMMNNKRIELISSWDLSLGKRNKREISKELSLELEKSEKNWIKIIQLTLLCIYAIRNAVFHGEWFPNSDSPIRDMLGIADIALASFLRETIHKAVAGKALGHVSYIKSETFRI